MSTTTVYLSDWVDFCMSTDPQHGDWYAPGTLGSSENDYKIFLKDLEAKEPRAIKFMLAYAKYKLTRNA